ncbi:hypothetical protein ACROYT_G035562 [Oculina patagonica]
MKNLILSPAVLLLILVCFGEGTIWETKEDIYESFQMIPSLQVTRDNLMKYFLDRQDYPRGKRYIPYYDIIFILDSSSSISRANFNLSLLTAQNLVERFDPDTQFAAVSFGTDAVLNFNFNSSKVAIESLGHIQYQGGKKNTLDALKKTQNMLLLNRDSGVRDGSRKRVLLVTDGPCERSLNDTAKLQRLIWATVQIKTLGPEVFVVAVGHRIPRIEELLLIPSSSDVHFYRVSNMAAFKKLVDGIAAHIVYQDDYFVP